MVQYLGYFTALVSIYTLVLMSLDRFLAVVYAVESMTWRTDSNCKIAIALTWIVCGLVCTPLIFSHGVDSDDPAYSYCVFLDTIPVPYLPQSWGLTWSKAAFTVNFWQLIIFLLVFFVSIKVLFVFSPDMSRILSIPSGTLSLAYYGC